MPLRNMLLIDPTSAFTGLITHLALRVAETHCVRVAHEARNVRRRLRYRDDGQDAGLRPDNLCDALDWRIQVALDQVALVVALPFPKASHRLSPFGYPMREPRPGSGTASGLPTCPRFVPYPLRGTSAIAGPSGAP